MSESILRVQVDNKYDFQILYLRLYWTGLRKINTSSKLRLLKRLALPEIKKEMRSWDFKIYNYLFPTDRSGISITLSLRNDDRFEKIINEEMLSEVRYIQRMNIDRLPSLQEVLEDRYVQFIRAPILTLNEAVAEAYQEIDICLPPAYPKENNISSTVCVHRSTPLMNEFAELMLTSSRERWVGYMDMAEDHLDL